MPEQGGGGPGGDRGGEHLAVRLVSGASSERPGAVRHAGAGQPGAGRDRRRGAHRRLAVLVVCALAGAGCCAGAAAIDWWRRDYHDPLSGPVTVSLKGSQILGGLIPIVLVVLAGLGAAFATRGVLRRAIGVLVALGGVLVGVRSALAAQHRPTADLAAQLHRPATALGPPDLTVAGPVVAIAGAVLIVLAGVLVLAGADRARRMGSAYEAPAARRESARSAVAGGHGPVDAGAMWRAIDAGADPTESPDPTEIDAPGHSGPSATDTMGPRDGPETAAGDRPDDTDVDRPRRSVPSSQASDEETTG